MNTTRRPRRFFWLFGLVLLVGTVAGATWVLNHAPAGTAPSRDDRREGDNAGKPQITYIGFVDVEDGITPLYPLQPGRVTAVYVKEGDAVQEGKKLFSVDNTLASDQLKEAQADLEAAQATVAKVEQLRAARKEQLAELESAIEAAKREAKAQSFVVQGLKKTLEGKFPSGTKEAFNAAQEKQAGAEALIKQQEAKLRGLRILDYAPELDQARKNVRAKEATVEKARKILAECNVFAPGDGSVLRLQITRGQVLGREPSHPAVQFCPNTPRIIRTEIQQEWGSGVKVGQTALIYDDTLSRPQWKGRVQRISDWYGPRRHRIYEPYQYNDVRTLECIISVDKAQAPLRIGQRMRVKIEQEWPK
jgi:multidrug resistance efflux pump